MTALEDLPYSIADHDIVAEADGMRVQVMTIGAGEEVPWHYHTAVTDVFVGLEGTVVIETRAPRARHEAWARQPLRRAAAHRAPGLRQGRPRLPRHPRPGRGRARFQPGRQGSGAGLSPAGSFAAAPGIEVRMIRSHGRYPYSSIATRPVYDWPNGTRLAVYVAVNVEQFSFGEGKGAAIAPPDQANSHSVYSWRDYGNRVGIWRMLELFDAFDVPIEAQMNLAVYEHCPDIPVALRERGHEILGHGITNSDMQEHLDEAAEAALIAEVTRTIERHEGSRPAGWMSPWISNSAVTPDLLQEAGYRYFMDWTCDDQPIWMKTRAGRILAMPYPVECNDTRSIVWYGHTAQEFVDMLIDGFDEMLAQSEGQPLVFPISLHPFVMGRPYRVRHLRRFFEHIAATEGAHLADAPARHLRPCREPAARHGARRFT